MAPELLIAIEGPDGVGKTTVCQLIKQLLDDVGVSVVLVKPGQAPFREFVDSTVNTISTSAQVFFWISTVCHLSSQIQSIREARVVISDRYIYSALAYAKARGVSLQVDLHSLGIRIPDFSFLLSADTAVLKERLSSRHLTSSVDTSVYSNSAFLASLVEEYSTFGLQCIDTTHMTPYDVAMVVLQTAWQANLPSSGLPQH